MNKLYSVITKSLLFILLLDSGGALKAQILNDVNILVNTSRTWTVLNSGQTITTCNNCTLTITGNAVLTMDQPVTFNGISPTGSVINVTNSSQLVIDANMTLNNTQVTIGDASPSNTQIASGTAGLFVANNTTLSLQDIVTRIRLANSNNTITGGPGTGNPSTAGQINYLPNGSTTPIGFFSGNPAVNRSFLNALAGHNSTPYSNSPNAVITGPALSNVNFFGSPVTAAFVSVSIILPITLVDFTASLNSNGSVGLTWATDEEENSSYFNVQRSANGGAWTNIGKVAAQGNSSVTTNYSFTDATPVSGTDNYRLQATDLDGTYTYSAVKVIRTTSQSAGFNVFPNPARDQVNVFLTSSVSDATIRLVDLSGKTLVEQKVTNAANTIVSIPVQRFVNGTYILVVRSPDGSQYSGKVLIAH